MCFSFCRTIQRKQALAWLALRQGAKQYLHAFGRIGTGDVELLDKEIAKTGQAFKGKENKERDNSPHVGITPAATPTAVPAAAASPVKTEAMVTEEANAESAPAEVNVTPMEVDG